jgi:ABC-type lipoprotein release transport system permease subunit
VNAVIPSTLRIAVRNLGRSRRRTALALGAIALAQMGVLAMNGFINGRTVWTIDTVTGPLMGHAQIHAPEWREEQAADLTIDDLDARLSAVRAAEGVSSAYARIYAPALAAHEVEGYAAMVVGVDPAAEAREGGLLEGLAAEHLPEGRQALVGSGLARQNEIEVGDEIAVLGQGADGSMANDLLTVIGIVETPVELVGASGIVVSFETAQEIFAMPNMAHEITVRGVGSGEEADGLAARLAALPATSGLEVLPWQELAPELAASVDASAAMGLVVVLIVFIAAASGVSNTMLMATFERRRELGMLLALGTTPWRLIRMILTEAVVLGLLGVVLGSIAGGLLVHWMGASGVSMAPGADASNVSAYGVTFNGLLRPFLGAGDYLPGLIGVSLVSILAAVWPAAMTAQLTPVEAMRS